MSRSRDSPRGRRDSFSSTSRFSIDSPTIERPPERSLLSPRIDPLRIQVEAAKPPPDVGRDNEMQQGEVWPQRLQRISTWIQAQEEITLLKTRLDDLQKLKGLPGVGDRVSERLAIIQTKIETANATQRDIELALVHSSGWPMQSPAARTEAELEDRYKEMGQVIQELKTTAEKIDQVLAGSIGSSKSDENAMDVDVPADTRPKKRRRVDASLEQMSDQVAGFNDRLDTFNNQLQLRDDDLRERLRDDVETRLARANFTPAFSLQLPLPSDLTQEVGEIGVQLAAEIYKVDEIQKRIADLQKENGEFEEWMAEMKTRLTEAEEEKKKDDEELHALRAALDVYTHRPPSPPPSPPHADLLLQLLESQFESQVRAEIKPVVEEFRQQVETRINERDAQLLQVIWPKLELTLKTLAGIATRIKSQPTTVIS